MVSLHNKSGLFVFMTVTLFLTGISFFRDHVSQNFVEAASAEQRISVNCEAPPISAYIPEVSYQVGWTGNGHSIPQINIFLSGAVNEDWTPDLRASHFKQGILKFSHRTPTMKLSGLLCRRDNAASLLFSAGQEDPSGLMMTVTRPHQGQIPFRKKMDFAREVLFGEGGVLSGEPLLDGEDYDGARNGEVVFGGDRVSEGGSETFFEIPWSQENLVIQSSLMTFEMIPSQH